MDVRVVGKAGETGMLCMLYTEERAQAVKKGREKAPGPVAGAIKAGDFTGKEGQAHMVPGDGPAKRILLAGLGKRKEADTEAVRKASACAAAAGIELKLKEFSVAAGTGITGEVAAIAEGAVLGAYDFDKYKKEKKRKPDRLQIVFSGGAGKVQAEAARASIIAEGTCMARDWVNEPADGLNPVAAAELAAALAKKHGIKCRVLGGNELKRMGMGLMLSVASGSRYPPRLVLLEHMKGKGRPVAIVGKGVTFDSGGLNLKPFGYIDNMKCDKAGAMAVLATMVTLARLKAKVNAVGLMGLVENMIGPDASKPGNIVKGYAGKTVEIIDTDAEGRLVLADVLAYAAKAYKPKLLIDLATLTGSAIVTFGEYVTAMLSTGDKEAEAMFGAGEKTYERVWRLPVYKEYEEEMKGEISDLKNLGYKHGRYAGCITAAAFLKQFTGKTPWLHLDIAGPAWLEKPKGYLPRGGSGFGVRLLMEYLAGSGRDEGK